MIRSASSLRPLSTITGTGVVDAHLAQHVETAHLRQTEVEHDELGLVVGDLVERGRAVAGVVDRVPLAFEGGADDVDKVEVVVDDEDHTAEARG